MTDTPSSRLVAMGVDGARSGWVAACLYASSFHNEDSPGWQTRLQLFPTIEHLPAFRHAAGGEAAVAIDVPIGLLPSVDYRPCDIEARELLGQRRNSVFAPPARYMLTVADDYDAICRLVDKERETNPAAKGLSPYAAGIAPKVKEVDDWVRATPRKRGMAVRVSPRALLPGARGGWATAPKGVGGRTHRAAAAGPRRLQRCRGPTRGSGVAGEAGQSLGPARRLRSPRLRSPMRPRPPGGARQRRARRRGACYADGAIARHAEHRATIHRSAGSGQEGSRPVAWCRTRSDGIAADPSRFQLGKRLFEARNPVDFQARREAFRDFTVIDDKTWQAVLNDTELADGKARKYSAAGWLWTELTGGYVTQAPALADAPKRGRELYSRFAATVLPVLRPALLDHGQVLLARAGLSGPVEFRHQAAARK